MLYDFKKEEDEKILLISDDTLLIHENVERNVSTIITNKRLILLDYPSGVNNYEEVLRIGRGVASIKKKEPIVSVKLKDINKVKRTKEFDIYQLKDGNNITIIDEMVYNQLK